MKLGSCPICDRELQGNSVVEFPQFPFCSPRCRLVDYGRWLGEDYRFNAGEHQDEDAPAEEMDVP